MPCTHAARHACMHTHHTAHKAKQKRTHTQQDPLPPPTPWARPNLIVHVMCTPIPRSRTTSRPLSRFSRTHAALEAFLHSSLPAGVDSMGVAGLADLLRTRGLWFASVRYGYVFGGLKGAGNLAELAANKGLWSKPVLTEVAAEFEAAWAEVVAKKMPGAFVLYSQGRGTNSSATIHTTSLPPTLTTPLSLSLPLPLSLSLSLSDRASLKKGKAHLMSASDMEAGFGSCYGDTPDSTGESGLTVEVASSSASSTKTDGSRIFTMASFRDDVINAVTPVMRKMLLAHPFSLPQVHTTAKPSTTRTACIPPPLHLSPLTSHPLPLPTTTYRRMSSTTQ